MQKTSARRLMGIAYFIKVKMYKDKLKLAFYFALIATLTWTLVIYVPSIKRIRDLNIKLELSNSSKADSLDEKVSENIFFAEKIVLAVISCPPPDSNNTRDETIVLLKSTIISAKLNKIKVVEIYFFFENVTREAEYFMKTLKEIGYPFESLNLTLHFESAVDAVPEKYRHQFISGADNHKLLRCTNVRIFFPSILANVDSLLYFDTDVIVHGNLAELWNLWSRMDDEQLIGMSFDYEEGSDKAAWFQNAPFPPPRGLNAGVLLMNLTRMRRFGWETKLLRIWNDYYKIVPYLNDQHLFNIMLYFNTDLLFRIPCRYNFMHQHCNMKSPCKSAMEDGLQLIHGADNKFGDLGAFRNIYLAYQEPSITEFDNVSIETFRYYIRKLYYHFDSIPKHPEEGTRHISDLKCRPILRKLI